MNLLRLREDPAWRDEMTGWVDESLNAHNLAHGRGAGTGSPRHALVGPSIALPLTAATSTSKRAARRKPTSRPWPCGWPRPGPTAWNPVWAADAARGWYMMPAGGPTLTSAIAAGGDEAAHWRRVLALQAAVQRDVMPAADELLAMGVSTGGRGTWGCLRLCWGSRIACW